MEFTLPLPHHLDTNGVLLKQWTTFSQRFHCHQNLVSKGTEASVLLFAANNQLKNVYESLKIYDLDSLKLGKILKVIEQLCLPSFLLLFERFRCFTLEQDASETLSDFIHIVTKQVELCEFGDKKDSIMVSTLANGVGDETIKHSLQNTDRLCFNDAVMMCSSLSKGSPTASTSVKETLTSNATKVSGSNVPIVPRKKKGLKQKHNIVSKLETNMPVVPLSIRLAEEEDTDNQIVMTVSTAEEDTDNHIVSTVVGADEKRQKVKRKKKCSSGQQTTSHSGIFLCFKCDKEYTSRTSFRRHIISKHGNCSEYFCKHCKITFYNRTECITHCMGHKTSPTLGVAGAGSKGTDSSEYLCWYCEETFPNLVDYKKHCLSHSAVRVFYCELCQRKNHTLPRLIGHLKGHLNPRFRCEICANCFSRAELLDSHMQTHAEQPVHQCHICGKNFVTAERLQVHIKTHTGEKRFTCELCGKSFCQKMTLEYHKRTHTGEKPYECDICGKRTALFDYLRKHKKKHSDSRPHVCEVCGKSFRFNSDLKRHRNGHSGKRAFACDVCGRTFIYREGLRDHIKADRCPGRRQEGVIKRASRAPRSKSRHIPNSSVEAHHASETLVRELPDWQYVIRNNESDGAEGLVVVLPYR